MTELFLTIVNMSISASWIALAVLILRQALKKAPKWVMVLLWGMVAFRLICPFTFESVLSLIPGNETISTSILIETPEINSGIGIIDSAVNPIIGEIETTVGTEKTINTFKLLVWIFARVWLIGIAIMLIYALVSYLRERKKVQTATLLKDSVYQSETVISPFVLGFIKPRIYLPYNMSEQDEELVIAHEKAHIKRKDHLWKPLGFIVLTLHWFNPLMWLGYVLFCKDIEIACDEKVIKELSDEHRADYSQALLNCSANRRMIAACPLAFGEVSVRNRVKAVLKYKKPALWVLVVAIISVTVTAVCFLTSPSGEQLKNIEFLNLEALPQNTVSIVKYDGENYEAIPSFSKDKLNELLNIYISKNEVSPNRSEDRDKTHTLILQTKNDLTPGADGAVDADSICFNEDFTEVWLDNNVKPTLSYKVVKPKKAQKIYEDIVNNE